MPEVTVGVQRLNGTGTWGALGAEARPRVGGHADSPRDFIPMKRFSTISMRPTPCLALWGQQVTRSQGLSQTWCQMPPTRLPPSGHIWTVHTPGPHAGRQAPSQDPQLRGHLSQVVWSPTTHCTGGETEAQAGKGLPVLHSEFNLQLPPPPSWRLSRHPPQPHLSILGAGKL